MSAIWDTPEWLITSYHNGLAYEIKDVKTSKSILLQGEDAQLFSDELDNITRTWADVCADYEELLV